MGKEPVLTTPNPAGTGRPVISEEQYFGWLQELKPHLMLACSLYAACVKAGLEDKYDSCILRKYHSGDWFSRKVDAYRASLGDSINEGLAREAIRIVEKAKRGELLNHDEIDILKHMSEKHRTAQPFFVSRTETGESKPEDLGKILDILGSDYDEFDNKAGSVAGSNGQAAEQTVAADAPVQNKE